MKQSWTVIYPFQKREVPDLDGKPVLLREPKIDQIDDARR